MDWKNIYIAQVDIFSPLVILQMRQLEDLNTIVAVTHLVISRAIGHRLLRFFSSLSYQF